MRPRLARKVFYMTLSIGSVLMATGIVTMLLRNEIGQGTAAYVTFAGAVFVTVGAVINNLFYRCPACHHLVTRGLQWQTKCPHCGRELD